MVPSAGSAFEKLNSPAVEAYKVLRTNLDFYCLDKTF
jgi:hypothetical protein